MAACLMTVTVPRVYRPPGRGAVGDLDGGIAAATTPGMPYSREMIAAGQYRHCR
jgi:hypothetical protein